MQRDVLELMVRFNCFGRRRPRRTGDGGALAGGAWLCWCRQRRVGRATAGTGARARGARPPHLIGQGAGVSRGAHGRRREGGGRHHPCPPWTQGGFGDLGPDGLRGRARVRAGAERAGAGLVRAWWATACEATAAGEGNEGARADFGSWAAERKWAAGRGCWAASCPRIEGATEDFRGRAWPNRNKGLFISRI
jgi:hypothetical protein